MSRPSQPLTPARRLSGVTLIELMVTLAIAVILLSLAVPGFQHLLQNSRLTGLTNSLSASLQQARVESLSRGQTVAVCATGDADADQPTCTITTDWADGWLVFVRDDADTTAGKTDIDSDGQADDRLLKVVRPFGAATLTASSGDPIVFTPPLGEAAETRFNIRVTDSEQNCLRVKRTGQVRLHKGSCNG
ncbi:GspH/FimT family pseudopilin [Marichromatium gracile]|uniref:GspH/FimT family pseudopilin n=1 Tax=Marichromatium gracile TaxID=1048 RepID=UPI001F239398|nr:GspH/FimT family pseudopilin [Marichromatium gracile]MCF1182089.1 GspH/FimT family pseudopilin [Marichromatium gracile]